MDGLQVLPSVTGSFRARTMTHTVGAIEEAVLVQDLGQRARRGTEWQESLVTESSRVKRSLEVWKGT